MLDRLAGRRSEIAARTRRLLRFGTRSRRARASVRTIARTIATALALGLTVQPGSAQTAPQGTVVLRASRVLDGRGGELRDVDVVVRDGRIAALEPLGSARGDVVYDLGSLTLLPGLIDTHVHITSYFAPDGTVHLPEAAGPVGELSPYAVENAVRTVMAGVTTVQSIGAPDDAALRDLVERGTIPGPRILSSLGVVRDETGSPEAIRRFVRERAAAGADVVKVFASSSIRFGGVTTVSFEQLEAACGEGRAQGLRSVVHAYLPEAAEMAARAGCSQIEHGWLLDEPSLRTVGEAGLHFGTQIGLLFENYDVNRELFVGAGYAPEGLDQLQAARSRALGVFRVALDVPGVAPVFSSDAIAGGHGRNVEELIAQVVEGGRPPMATVVSATSAAADALGMGDRIGSIEVGFEADVIALDGDPLTDPSALRRVAFVMRGDGST